MAIDWTPLEQRTTSYTTLTSKTDPVSGLVTAVYCGLHAKLSQVLAGAPPAGFFSPSVFSDTLELDVETVKTVGLIVMARDVDCTALAGKPLTLDTSGREGVAQFLAGGASGGDLTLATPNAPAVAVPVNPTARSCPVFTVAANS